MYMHGERAGVISLRHNRFKLHLRTPTSEWHFDESVLCDFEAFKTSMNNNEHPDIFIRQ